MHRDPLIGSCTTYFDASTRSVALNICSGYRAAKWRTSIVDGTVSNLGLLTCLAFYEPDPRANTKSRQRVARKVAGR